MELTAWSPRQRYVLVVDDEPQNVTLLAKRLTAAGLHVIGVGSGREALQRARGQQPDLILLDLHMPGMDGLAVLEHLQASPDTASIPVIFVSAEEETAYRVTALGLGGRDFITKPFHPEELLARVGVALRTRAVHEELRSQHQEMDQMLRRDPLTGLYNRRHLDEALTRELRCSRDCRRPLSVAMIDLDHFKAINDSFGHPIGDRVLADIGRLITSRIRQGDTFGRYGGEEFLLILPGTPARGAFLLLDQIRGLVAGQPFAGCGGRPVTFSAGIATTETGEVDPMGLISLADRRLYEAKRSGRNRIMPVLEPGNGEAEEYGG
jgi:two-component system, cell cycle response regulator